MNGEKDFGTHKTILIAIIYNCVEQKTEKDDICCQLVKIIIIRYSYPTNSIKITTKDIATVPYGPSVITFLLIRYIKELLGII